MTPSLPGAIRPDVAAIVRDAGGTLIGSDEGLARGWFPPEAAPPDPRPYARVWLADALADAEATSLPVLVR